MNIDQVCDAIIDYCVKKRSYTPTSNERTAIREDLKKIIIDQKLNFYIDNINVSYQGDEHADTLYPRLCGDAVLHYTYAFLERYKNND